MNLVGIDVGSDSVRISIREGTSGVFKNSERQLRRKVDGNKHTMSGPQLWAHIVSILVEFDESFSAFSTPVAHSKRSGDISEAANDSLQGVCEPTCENFIKASCTQKYSVNVAATCSMVVMNRVKLATGTSKFVPVTPGEEVIVWMDTRARSEAHELSKVLPDSVLAHIGGTVTPEMGIAKLKWVSDSLQNDSNNICVFELYDWVTYVFLAGGYDPDGSVSCLPNDVATFPPRSMAMDGSVKGWGQDILKVMDLRVNVCCTPNVDNLSNSFPHVGTILGKIRDVAVAHGCIDCYAGWAGQVACTGSTVGEKRDANSSSLLIVAGTSTCFIASVTPEESRGSPPTPVAGIWGPFAQLLASPVYSFGQPSTGQLFTELFADFADIIGDNEAFSFLLRHIRALEARYTTSLTVLARHYFYYGDKHGNRSPFGDFRMGEMTIDGKNARSMDTFQCSIHEKSIESLVLRYYLIIEFLVFQTKHLCCKLQEKCGDFSQVYISGSQAQNELFVRMLDLYAFPDSRLLVQKGVNTKYSGSQGIALSMFASRDKTREILEDTWVKVDSKGIIRVAGDSSSNDKRESAIFLAKYKAFVEMAHWQKSFHDTMGSL